MSDEYIKRHAEKTVEKLSKMFGAVLVAGPRQVGKPQCFKRSPKILTMSHLMIRL